MDSRRQSPTEGDAQQQSDHNIPAIQPAPSAAPVPPTTASIGTQPRPAAPIIPLAPRPLARPAMPVATQSAGAAPSVTAGVGSATRPASFKPLVVRPTFQPKPAPPIRPAAPGISVPAVRPAGASAAGVARPLGSAPGITAGGHRPPIRPVAAPLTGVRPGQIPAQPLIRPGATGIRPAGATAGAPRAAPLVRPPPSVRPPTTTTMAQGQVTSAGRPQGTPTAATESKPGVVTAGPRPPVSLPKQQQPTAAAAAPDLVQKSDKPAPAPAPATKTVVGPPPPKPQQTTMPAVPASRAPVVSAPSEIEPAIEPTPTQHQQQQLEEEPERSGSGGWGWGASLSRLGKTFISDVSQLAESFQQHVIQEMDADSDEDGTLGMNKGSTTSTVGAGQGSSSSQPPSATAPATSTTANAKAASQEDLNVSKEELERRQQVLERLASKGEEPQLAKITQAVDQVEALASGALGSLWTWGGNIAAPLAAKVEQVSVQSVNELRNTANEAGPAVATVQKRAAAAGAKAEFYLGQTLGAFSKTAQGLFEGGLVGGHQGFEGPTPHETLTFEECFSIYGGHQAEEELLTLSNECSRLCNRIRSKMSDTDQLEMDRVLAALAPIFDLQVDIDTQGNGAPQEPPALGREHAVIADLAAAARKVALVLAAEAGREVEKAVADVDAQRGDEAPVPSEIDNTGEKYDIQQNSSAPIPEVSENSKKTEGKDPYSRAFGPVSEEAIKRLSEVCSVCVERVLSLSRSLNSQVRHGRPSSDGIYWASRQPEETALLLRVQVLKMAKELQAVQDTFIAALEEIKENSMEGQDQGNESFDKIRDVVDNAVSAVQKDGQAAGDKLDEAFRAVLYVVWQLSIGQEWFGA